MENVLEYKNYYGSVHFSSKDEILYGKLIGIDALITFEGESVKQVKTSFQEAVDDYLETCKEHGKDPEQPLIT
jgi:predicted HicB family RNase H-like nuclease